MEERRSGGIAALALPPSQIAMAGKRNDKRKEKV